MLSEIEEELKENKENHDLHKHFLVYQEECSRLNWLFANRCVLIDPPENHNMSFTNFIAMILCQNFIPWEPGELRENFINYGQLIMPNETSTGLKCRERIIDDMRNLNLPAAHFTFHDNILQWKVHFHRMKDSIIAYENSERKDAHKRQSEKMLSQIALLQTMIKMIGFEPVDPSGSTIEVPPGLEEMLKELFKECSNCAPGKKKKVKAEEPQELHLPLQRLDNELKCLFIRYTKVHETIKNIDINTNEEPPELRNDRDLPDQIQALIKRVEDMVGKWKSLFRGEQAILYFNGAEFYLQHVLALLREYLVTSRNLLGFRRVIYWKFKKISDKKDFVEHSRVVLNELSNIEETMLNIYGKTLKIPDNILKYDEEHGPFEWNENLDIVFEKLQI